MNPFVVYPWIPRVSKKIFFWVLDVCDEEWISMSSALRQGLQHEEFDRCSSCEIFLREDLKFSKANLNKMIFERKMLQTMNSK